MIRPVQPGWRQTAVACRAGRAPGTPRLVAVAAGETLAGLTGAPGGRAGGLRTPPGGPGVRDPAGLGPDEPTRPRGDVAGAGTAAVAARGTELGAWVGAGVVPGVGGIPQTSQ